MNYSNMIEEKSLKKTFIVATLISTIFGTFTAADTLYTKVQDRKTKQKQMKLDNKQNGEIEGLRKRIEALDSKAKGGEEDDDKRSAKGSKSRRSSPERRPKAIKYIPDEVQEELEVAGPLIRREYNRGYDVLGSRFAMGDGKFWPNSAGAIPCTTANVLCVTSDDPESTSSSNHRSPANRHHDSPTSIVSA